MAEGGTPCKRHCPSRLQQHTFKDKIIMNFKAATGSIKAQVTALVPHLGRHLVWLPPASWSLWAVPSPWNALSLLPSPVHMHRHARMRMRMHMPQPLLRLHLPGNPALFSPHRPPASEYPGPSCRRAQSVWNALLAERMARERGGDRRRCIPGGGDSRTRAWK